MQTVLQCCSMTHVHNARGQGDRKAGPSLSSYNYESVWGQQALKHMYRAVLEEEVPLVSIALC